MTMILAVDIGNTHVCFGFVNETSRVLSQFRIPTDLTETSFGYAAKMRSIFDFSRVSLEETEGAVISSVVPSVTVAVKEAVRLLISKEALVVGAGIRSGLKIAIDDPGTVASDLVATAVAAKAQYPLPCVIVDVGTATTVSYINRNAEFAGVSILPGVALGMEALSEGTSLLPKIELRPPKRVLGTNTVEALRSGILYGAVGAIEGILQRLEEELGSAPSCIVLTGGLAPSLICAFKRSVIIDEDLILKGLGIIFYKNKTNQ